MNLYVKWILICDFKLEDGVLCDVTIGVLQKRTEISEAYAVSMCPAGGGTSL